MPNKNDLINFIAEKAVLSKADAGRALDAFQDIISEQLSQGEKVNLVGFGSFQVKERKARKGRNPQTGEEIDIPASKTVKFNPGKGLRDIVA